MNEGGSLRLRRSARSRVATGCGVRGDRWGWLRGAHRRVEHQTPGRSSQQPGTFSRAMFVQCGKESAGGLGIGVAAPCGPRPHDPRLDGGSRSAPGPRADDPPRVVRSPRTSATTAAGSAPHRGQTSMRKRESIGKRGRPMNRALRHPRIRRCAGQYTYSRFTHSRTTTPSHRRFRRSQYPRGRFRPKHALHIAAMARLRSQSREPSLRRARHTPNIGPGAPPQGSYRRPPSARRLDRALDGPNPSRPKR